MKDFMSVAKTIGHHGQILCKGFLRMVFGAATAGLLGSAIYGFIMIATDSGWTAVCEFVAAIAMMVFAVTCMYIQGGNGKKRGARR